MSVANSATPIWKCDFTAIEPLESLTVGSRFGLNCSGDIEVDWSSAPQIVFPASEKQNEHKYDLVILEVLKQEPRQVQYVVTGYKPGDFAPEYVRVLAGGKGFETNGLQWKVQSVLPRDKQPQVYPSMGPYNMPMPYWVWLVVLAGAVLLGLVVYRLVRRGQQRKKVLKMLQDHNTSLTPHGQFHKDLRQIKKVIESQPATLQIVQQLDTEFRLYLLRTFKIPALDWSDTAVLRDLRKRSAIVYDTEAKRIAKTLRELTQLKKSDSIKTQDVEQLFTLSRDTVDRIERVRGLK